MRLTDLLALSIVPRWSVVPHHGHQSVADHSFRVVVILRELADRLSITLTAEDLWYALTHDGAESVTGDIPGKFKARYLPDIRQAELAACPWLDPRLVPIGRALVSNITLVKLADLIETYTWIAMNGYGPHALTVQERIWLDVQNLCDGNTEMFAAAHAAAHHVVCETGRAYATSSVEPADDDDHGAP